MPTSTYIAHTKKLKMKKVLFVIIFLHVFFSLSATEFTVQVSNFQFTPSALTISLGDVVKFVWVNGSHTTTSATIPAGAASWDKPMNSGSTVFNYTPTVLGLYNYVCTPHEAFGMIGTITVEAVVPVILKSFQVTSSPAGKALLQWATASEQGTQSFEVLRSIDGIHFEKIAEIAPAGNSTTEKNYSYTDNTISKQRFYYYSIKIKDVDGSSTTSQVSLFRNLSASVKIITKLSPNPLTSPAHLMIEFEAEQAGTLKARLYDAKGNLILDDDLYAVIGFNKGHLHIGNIAAGSYTVVFIMGDQKETHNIVVQ